MDFDAAAKTGDQDAAAWAEWMKDELTQQMVGVTAGTSRATVRTVGVHDAKVIKGPIRAVALDIMLELEATHVKEAGKKVNGIARLVLKTEDALDMLRVVEVQWPEHHPFSHQQSMDDITFAVQQTLDSALAAVLNNVLWNVERHSMDMM
eukprot:CAMPEP_0202891050 /NCGR_PEP_ID=MMETSP1392-20130828/1237_1 /ASSEMBLY_ACC=CAM_ASM_000868 /TAXON_ID=225041 /ORGANISM="Chlamydomonas chlamydogama, Strain SAG 11-48b" /LENGTH=149 /DNA_ID=CAMNT_0049574717 /DNA_START=291 /DNA_END=740 /DNA_ORIENTATION=+